MTLRRAGGHDAAVDFPLHNHDTWEVIYQRTGQVQTRQDTDIFAMSPGMVLVHPPGICHADIASRHYEIYFLHIEVEGIPAWPRLCHDDRHQSIGKVCDALCREFLGADSGRDRMLELLTGELDILLCRAFAEQNQTSGEHLVSEVQRIMEERFRDRIRMSALSAEIGVSRATLYTHFARLRGQTPPEYLLSVRLRHALGLLHHSDLTLDAIAERSGFHSASHLSRHIKASTGSSPGSLRKVSPAASSRLR